MRALGEAQRARYRQAGAMSVAAGVVLLAAHCGRAPFLGYVGAGMFVVSLGLWVSAQ